MHYTQKQMVEETYISVSHYSKIENGSQEIKAVDLFNLLDKRQIDINTFKAKIDDNNKVNNLDVLGDELVKAFYKPDIAEARRVKAKIDKFQGAEELKIRAELIVAVLTHNIKNVKADLSHRVIKYLLENKKWTQNAEMLRVIGNSVEIFDFDVYSLLMSELLNEYQQIEKYPMDVQKRIASIYVNYLHGVYIHKKFSLAKNYLQVLNQLSDAPELVLFKVLGLYYENIFEGNNTEAKEIITPIQKAMPKLVNGLPIK